MNPVLKFYGGVGTATGACIMLEFAGKKILVDCGLTQGSRELEARNFKPFAFDPALVDALFVTHAHIDHIGRIPFLVRSGFRGKIYSTAETRDLATIMWPDALRVYKSKYKDQEFYEEVDIANCLKMWESVPYHHSFGLGDSISVLLYDAGHILGSSIIKFTCQDGAHVVSVGFTGDLGNSPSPLLPDTEIPEGLDYMVMESVYGDREHEDIGERRSMFKETILDAIQKDGTIVVPSFSIERTQVLLFELNNLVESGEIPSIPVYLDSPLATKVTAVYARHTDRFKQSVRDKISAGDDIFEFPKLKIVDTRDESLALDRIEGAKIIFGGSGMSEGGRVVNHEIHYLEDPKATILQVGYQAAGTFGRRIQEGSKTLRIGNRKINVRAKTLNITGYSSHKDSSHLLDFVEDVGKNGSLKQVFVMMGETSSSLFLCQRIRDYVGKSAILPEVGKEYMLI